MKIIKYFLLSFLLIMALGYVSYNLLFDTSIASSKYTGVINLSKKNVGGVVYNETSKTIEVSDYLYIKRIPPHENSKAIGVFDVDSIIIDRPMYFENKEYNNKVLKFCDYGKFKIIEKKGKTTIQPLRPVWICKLINDFDFYNSMNEAFRN